MAQAALVAGRRGRDAGGHPRRRLRRAFHRRSLRAARLADASRGARPAAGDGGADRGLPGRLLRARELAAALAVLEGHDQVRPAFRLPRGRHAARDRPRRAALAPNGRRLRRGSRHQLRLRRRAARRAGRWRNQPRQGRNRPADVRSGQPRRHQRLRPGHCRAVGQLRLPRGLSRERARARPQPPRDHAVRPDSPAHPILPACRTAQPPRSHACRLARLLPARGRAHALALGLPRPRLRPGDPRLAVAPATARAPARRPGGGRARGDRPRAGLLAVCAPGRALARDGQRQLGQGALPVLRPRAARAGRASGVRPRPEHVLGLLRVPDGQDQLGPALLLHRVARRDGPGRAPSCSRRSLPGSGCGWR